MVLLGEIFSEAPVVKADGGVFIPQGNEPCEPILAKFLATARQRVNDCNKSCINQPLLPSYVGMTNNRKIITKAFRYKNIDFIAISWGTVAYLYYFFHLVLSFPQIFQGIAGSHLEHAPKINQLKLNNSLDDLFAAANPMASPNSIQRRQLAAYLSHIAFNYIVYHEIAHIRHGHLGLIDEALNGAVKITKEDRYAMEYDADCFATTSILNYIVPRENFFEKVGIKFPPDYSSRENTYFAHFFPIYMFFRVYVDIESVYGHYSQSHPASFLRMQLPFSLSEEASTQRPFLDQNLLAKAALRVISEGELAASLLTDQSFDVSGIKMATSEIGIKMMADLEIYWKALRPRLLNHAYSGLAD